MFLFCTNAFKLGMLHCGILAHSVKCSRSSGCFTHTANLHEEREKSVITKAIKYTHISMQFNSYLKWLFQKVTACIKRVCYLSGFSLSMWPWNGDVRCEFMTTGPGSAQGPALYRGNVSDGGRCRSRTHTHSDWVPIVSSHQHHSAPGHHGNASHVRVSVRCVHYTALIYLPPSRFLASSVTSDLLPFPAVWLMRQVFVRYRDTYHTDK